MLGSLHLTEALLYMVGLEPSQREIVHDGANEASPPRGPKRSEVPEQKAHRRGSYPAPHRQAGESCLSGVAVEKESESWVRSL